MTDQETETLLAAIRPAVTKIAKRYYTRDAETVEDLVQQHSLLIWEMRQTLDTNQNPRAYAIGRMYYLCREYIQKRGRRRAAGLQEGGYEGLIHDHVHGPLHEADDDEAQEEFEALSWNNPLSRGDEASTLRDADVQRAVQALEPEARELVLAILVEGQYLKDVARQRGLSTRTTRKRLRAGVKVLQQRLKEWRTLS